MKFRLSICLTLLAIFGLSIFGAIYRSSYTNVVSQPNYLDLLMVAEISQKSAEVASEKFRTYSLDAPFIFRVSVVDDVEHLFNISRQKVRVEETYAGEGVVAGEEIYLTSEHWSLIYNPNDTEKCLERGYVNVLKTDYEYLVFVSEEVSLPSNEKIPVFRVYDELILCPIFCYENLLNVVVPVRGASTYVPYNQVKNNEFFVTTEGALQVLTNLKTEILALYPPNK